MLIYALFRAKRRVDKRSLSAVCTVDKTKTTALFRAKRRVDKDEFTFLRRFYSVHKFVKTGLIDGAKKRCLNVFTEERKFVNRACFRGVMSVVDGCFYEFTGKA